MEKFQDNNALSSSPQNSQIKRQVLQAKAKTRKAEKPSLLRDQKNMHNGGYNIETIFARR